MRNIVQFRFLNLKMENGFEMRFLILDLSQQFPGKYFTVFHNVQKTGMLGLPTHPVVCRSVHVLFTLFLLVCVKWYQTHILLCFYFIYLQPNIPVFWTL
jgi:hypothetical protein